MKTQAAAAEPRRQPLPAEPTTLARTAEPRPDPGLRAVLTAVQQEARKQKHVPPPSEKRKEAENASALEIFEQNDQSSKEKNTEAMGHVALEQRDDGLRFGAERFKTDFRALVAKQSPPQTASEVKAFARDPPLKEFPTAISNDVVKQQGELAQPLQQQALKKPPPDKPKDVVSIPAPVYPARPVAPSSKSALPPRRTDWQTWAPAHRETLNSAMDANRLTEDQLAASREPTFLSALSAKQQAQQKIDEAPDAYGARESALLDQTEASLGESLSTGLQGMNSLHRLIGGRVHGSQKSTETQTEKRQREIKAEIDGIYQGTVKDVGVILSSMAGKVRKDFETALTAQSKLFNENLRERISDYYGWTTLDDKLFGPDDVVVEPDGRTRAVTLEERFGIVKAPRTINPAVYRLFLDEKRKFILGMDGELDKIADSIAAGLNQAALRIELGKVSIALFKATLKGDEKRYADKLEVDVTTRFENLKGSIDDARSDLLNALADQYRETTQQLETAAYELNEELRKSFIDRAVDFIAAVGSTVAQLADLLFSVLTRMAHLVWDIIQHPIRFFGTLVEGIGRGVGQFIDGFGTYLQEGFWTWISGATPAKNIRLSGGSGIENLFDVVVQVLSLGRPQLWQIAEGVFGKPVMDRLDQALALGEKALEPLNLLFTKGPLALWDRIQESLSELVQSTFERIKESVFFALIRKALKWIAGFFVPGGGFVKVVNAIFRAFQFVAENLQNIREFFDAVFDSMQEALDGRSDGVAAKVLYGLKTGIVLALDFLAKQLGLTQLIDEVQKIIQSLRRPIVKAITWLLTQIKPVITRIVETTVKLGKAAVERVRAWWTARKSFTSEEGEAHSLYLEGSESGAKLMIRSEPQTYSEFIHSVLVPENKLAAKSEALAVAEKLDAAVKRAVAHERRSNREAKGLTEDPSREITNRLDELAVLTSKFIPEGSGASSEPVFGPLVHGFGSSVRVDRLTRKHVPGSGPSVEGGDWDFLRLRFKEGDYYYVRGHLLNDNIGGSGKTWSNLTPLTQAANNKDGGSMLNGFETAVKERVAKKDAKVHFRVTANYGRDHHLASWISDLAVSEQPDDRIIAQIIRAEQSVPTTVVCEAHEVGADGRKVKEVKTHTVRNQIDDASIENYQLTKEPRQDFYINDYLTDSRRAKELTKLGVTQTVITALLNNKPPGGYRTPAQLAARGLDWESARATKGLRVRIYRR
jgi:hypothetical protein